MLTLFATKLHSPIFRSAGTELREAAVDLLGDSMRESIVNVDFFATNERRTRIARLTAGFAQLTAIRFSPNIALILIAL